MFEGKRRIYNKKIHFKSLKKYLIVILIGVHLFLINTSDARDSYQLNVIEVFPNQNLQEIIDSASPYSTILLNPGTYKQSIIIDKPLIINGQDKNTTILTLSTKPNNAGISLSASHIIFSNLSITNNATGLYTTAIRINEPYCSIQDCIFYDTPIGIAVWTNYTTITRTSFHNCSDEGILLISTSISNSHYNRIHACNFYNNCDAIELQHSSYNTFSNCIMEKNTHSAIDAICDNNNHNIISNCVIKNNTVHGIYFSSSYNNLIQNCSFENNGEEDILFTHNSHQNTIIEKKSNSSKSIEKNEFSSFTKTGNESSSFSSKQSIDQNKESLFQRIMNLIEKLMERFHDFQDQLINIEEG